MNIQQAVILAAGEGKRMRPLTYTRPKGMLPIANKPILEHILVEIKKTGIADFIFIIGYQGQEISNYFGSGDKWGVNIEYFRQINQLGTSDAIRILRGVINDRFLLINGDNLLNHQDVIALKAKNGNVLGVVEMDNVSGLGVVETDGDHILHIYEKMEHPVSHLANAGIYLFTPEIFDAIERTPKSKRGEYELPDTIQIMINSGQIINYYKISRWFDLTYPWDLLNVNEIFTAEAEMDMSGIVEDNVVLKGPVSVGQGTIIKSGSYLVGPIIIGNKCDIGPNCYIRPSTTIGDSCHIGASVEIKNSIIMSGSKVPHLSYVGDSVIGTNCNLGAGTKIANLRLDKKNISIGDIDTKRRKLGAIIGDNVETGINVSINIGTLIGNNTYIGPGALVHGVISPGSKIF